MVVFSLPHTGLHSIQIRKQIIKLFSSAYPYIQLRCIFRPVQRLLSFFRFKDRIPLALRSRVVYKFKCQCCDALYFGETRISEHMGISACTGKRLSKPSFSNILSHHQSYGHPIDPDDFSILTSCSSTFELLLRESLLITPPARSAWRSYKFASLRLLCCFRCHKLGYRSWVIPLCILLSEPVSPLLLNLISSKLCHQNTQFNMYILTSKQQEGSTCKDS